MANSINLDEQAKLQSLTTQIIKDGAVTPAKIDQTSSFTFGQNLTITGNLIVSGTGTILPAGIIRPSNISTLTTDNFVFPNSVDVQALFVHGDLNLNNNSLTHFRVENMTSTPVNGNPGRLIWRSDIQELLVDNGLGFAIVGGGAAVGSIKADANTPLLGAITLASGTGISLAQSGQTITVNSSAITSLTGDIMAFGPGAATTSIVDGAVTPNKISTTNTDDFSFPNNLIVAADLNVSGTVRPVAFRLDNDNPDSFVFTQPSGYQQILFNHNSSTLWMAGNIYCQDQGGNYIFNVDTPNDTFSVGLPNGSLSFNAGTLSVNGIVSVGTFGLIHLDPDGSFLLNCISTDGAGAVLSLINRAAIGFEDATGTKNVFVSAPQTLTNEYSINWPLDQGGPNTTLLNDGSGNLSWASSGGSASAVSTLGVATESNAQMVATGITQSNGSTQTVYTVPSGKRAIWYQSSAYNTTGGTLTIQPGVVHNSISRFMSQSTNVGSGINNIFHTAQIVLEAGDQAQVTSSGPGMNIRTEITEFDNTAAIKGVIVNTMTSGDNVAYTCPSGKTARIGFTGPGLPSSGLLEIFNNSGSARTYHVNLVPNGGSPGSSNQITAAQPFNSNVSLSSETIIGTLAQGDFVSINTDSSASGQLVWFTVLEF